MPTIPIRAPTSRPRFRPARPAPAACRAPVRVRSPRPTRPSACSLRPTRSVGPASPTSNTCTVPGADPELTASTSTITSRPAPRSTSRDGSETSTTSTPGTSATWRTTRTPTASSPRSTDPRPTTNGFTASPPEGPGSVSRRRCTDRSSGSRSHTAGSTHHGAGRGGPERTPAGRPPRWAGSEQWAARSAHR